jgi:apolipoprotein N-acyltransferase
MEYFQALSLSFVSWNTSSLVGFHWTFGHIGYALAEYPRLLSLASFGGVYFLSFVVMFFNGLFFRLLTQVKLKRLHYIEVGISFFILLLISNMFFILNNRALMGAPSVRVASMYTTFGPLAETSRMLSLERKMRVANLFDVILYEKEHPELILLPEYTGYIASLSKTEKRELVSRMSTETNVAIVDSRRVRSIDNDYNVSVLELETGDGFTQSYTKQLLVPTAEYIPLSIMFLGNMFLNDGWSNSFETKLTLGKGNKTTVIKHNELRIGALFCGEVITPQLYRETTRRGANLLVNVASHSFLNNSVHLYNQVVKFSKTRAVENNRYFVQSGNLAPSFVINNHGRLLGETDKDKNTVLYADVILLTNTTFANKIGGLWILVFLLLSLVGLRKTDGVSLGIKAKT